MQFGFVGKVYVFYDKKEKAGASPLSIATNRDYIRLVAKGAIEGSKRPFFSSSLTPRNKSIEMYKIFCKKKSKIRNII